jgi:hypothetical protein
MAKLENLIIHCTDTLAGRSVSAEDIRRWHTAPPPIGNGWRQVGYTDMVHLGGQVERLVDNNEDGVVDTWEITNGVAGVNGVSRHIVYVGGKLLGKPADTRTEAQKESLKSYVLSFLTAHPTVLIGGHRDYAKGKDCPSCEVGEWLKSIGVPAQNITKK